MTVQRRDVDDEGCVPQDVEFELRASSNRQVIVRGKDKMNMGIKINRSHISALLQICVTLS